MKIILASCDDWEGLYREDGTLVTQGHSITLRDLCFLLGVELEYKRVDDDWAAEQGGFPRHINKIPKEFIK